MTAPDHYATLGVLPEAERIVIVAAYRALAQRYHPDRSSEDPVDAHRRMSEINEAYRVLGNEKLRTEYDATRRKDERADYRSAESEESNEAFGSALNELEGRWSVATEIFSDLTALRDSLAKISTSLAFGFVTILLNSRRYNDRAEIAATLEQKFLERYFGTNANLILYAKELITAGHRDAAKTLNNLVDVMGSDVDPNLLIQRVEKQYAIRASRVQRRGVEEIAAKVLELGYIEDAYKLTKSLGYNIREHSTGFLGSNLEITVTSPQGVVTKYRSPYSFIEWVKAALCP